MTDIDIDIDAKLQISPADLVGERVVILGASGSGKSNTAAALVEELIGEFPITIIDPDGDYFGIREKYAALWIGDMEEADLPVGDPEQAAAIAELSFCRGVSVILDFSESKPSVMIEFLTAYLDRLWALSSPRKARKPYGILVEEAAVFVPQGGKNTPLREVLVAIATRGRKRGITTMLVGQRATKIDKDLVTQARWFILHQVIFPNDLALYKEIVPLPDAEVERMVNGLAVGQAIFRHEKTLESVTIRKRHTFHSGATPGLEEVEHPPLQKVDTALLAELREMMGRSAPIPLKAVSTTNGKPSASDKSLADMREKITRLQKTIEDLQSTVNLLKKQLEERDRQLVERDKQIDAMQRQIDRLKIKPVPAKPLPAAKPAPSVTVGAMQTSTKALPDGRVQYDLKVENLDVRINRPAAPAARTARTPQVAQQQAFDLMLAELGRMSMAHRSLFKLLLENDRWHHGSFTAARLGYGADEYSRRPPRLLMDRHLIVRSGKGMKADYQSMAREGLALRFPDLDVEQLIVKVKEVV